MISRLFAVRRGIGVVEYALGFNILLVLTVGVIDVARGVWISNSLSFLAREGTRYGTISTRTKAEIESHVVSRARLPDLDGDSVPDITVVATRCNGTMGSDNVTLTHVAVSAPFESLIGPIIGGIWGGGPLTLRASSRLYVEGTFDNPLAGLGGCP
jgi:hypothetical protein